MDLKTVTKKGTKHTHVFRVGRGIGSGLGKTCGRGHKGWGQRSGAPRRAGYEGGQMPIYRRVPKRGFTNASFSTEYTVINVDALEVFANGDTIDLGAVITKGLVSMNTPLFKVLGNGDLTKKLIVRAQKFTASARRKIEAAGGQVLELDKRGREIVAEPTPDPKAATTPTAPAAKPAKSRKPPKSPDSPASPDIPGA